MNKYPISQMIPIEGDIYPVKEALVAIGAQWRLVIHPDMMERAKSIVSRVKHDALQSGTEAFRSRREREAFLETLRSDRGGWTRSALKTIGIKWPPKKGWRKNFLNGKGKIIIFRDSIRDEDTPLPHEQSRHLSAITNHDKHSVN